jgi:FKBP-type peptidyl-prolyl cis-trans isomerase FklB
MKKMRKISLLVVVLMSISSFISCQNQNSAKVEIKSEIDSLSYAIGIDLASRIEKSGVDNFNAEALAKGFKDAFKVENPAMDNAAANAIIQNFFKKMADKESAEAVEEGKKFLAENAKKEGVKLTESGLQYKVLKEGEGDSPKPTDVVEVFYKGTLIDGTVFDETHDKPVSFPVNGVIPGWTEALQLMKVGSKYQLFIPSELAYGERGAGGQIKPNSTLIFEVELLSIKPKEEKK